MSEVDTAQDRFLRAVAGALRVTTGGGSELFDALAQAALAELGTNYVGLAFLAPTGGSVSQIRHRGRAVGDTDAEDLLRARLRAWRTAAVEERHEQVAGPGMWAVWPLRRGQTLAGALAMQWPRRDGAPQPAARLDAVVQLAGAVLVRVLALEEIRHVQAELLDENEYLREEIRTQFRPDNMVWVSGVMDELAQTALRVAASTATVLVHGETGTGKELIAHLVHEHSPRANRPFIRVNCAALPEALLESELFGHVRGSFTGATADRKGRFEAADGGTLFLDEVGDVSPKLQVRLLRVLQEREIERVGEQVPRRVDVRVVAATHRTLEEEVAAGRFREDLYYRLNVVYLHVPPLRDRRADILPLAEHFLDRYNRQNFKRVRLESPGVIARLTEYHWPGNVRELQNCIEKAVVLAPGEELTLDLLPAAVAAVAGPAGARPPAAAVTMGELVRAAVDEVVEAGAAPERGLYRALVAQVEGPLLAAVLARTQGNQLAACRLLGLNRNTLREKLREHGLHPRQGAGRAGQAPEARG